MKTTKFVLTIALISFAVLAFSKPDTKGISVKIKFSTALENRALVKAMYQQLDVSLLHSDGPRYIIARVNLNNVAYFIYGTYAEWKNFFIMDLDEDPVGKKAPGKRLATRVK